MSKRVCAVLTYPNRHIVDVFESLKLCNYEVDYFFFNPIPDFRKNNNWAPPSSSTFLSLRHPHTYTALFKQFKNGDAVFFQGLLRPSILNGMVQIISQFMGVKRFILSEGSRKKSRPNVLFRAIASALFNSPTVQHLSIGNSSSRDYYNYGLTNWRFRKFCFCENYDSAEGQKWLDVDDRELVILCAGRLIKRKNFSEVIRSLYSYSGAKNVTVAICGDGPEEENLRLLAKDLPEKVSVFFAGHISMEELNSFYRRADIFVLPSLYEGWGVVVNHALHFGLPMILRSTVRSGIDYLLLNGKNGFSYVDTDSLTQAIVRLAEEDELRESMSEASFEHNKLWCMRSVISRLDQLIQDRDVHFENGPLTEVYLTGDHDSSES